MPVELAAVDHAQRDEVEAYERLLTDAMQRGPASFRARGCGQGVMESGSTTVGERYSDAYVRTGVVGTRGSRPLGD